MNTTAKYKKTLATTLILISSFLVPKHALATRDCISNPAINPIWGNDCGGANDGTIFGQIFASAWNTAIIFGALTVLVLFIIAAYEWLGAGGDKGKLEKARNRMTQGIIGLVLLVGSFVIINFISFIVFGDTFSILNPFGNFTAPGF